MQPLARRLNRRQFIRCALAAGLGGAAQAACGPARPPASLPAVTHIPEATAQTATARTSAFRDLDLAPPAVTVDGLRAVPIDIQQISAKVVFDLSAHQASAEATVDFRMGDQAGSPIFDLRQEIAEAFLDDQPLPPETMHHHDFGGGPGAELRILETALPAGGTHRLRLRYPLGTPQAPDADPALVWDTSAPGLSWDLWLSDLKPARYLEMWLPANLIYDRFQLSLEIALVGAAREHAVITNGRTTRRGMNHWLVECPPHFTALSTMLLIHPQDQLASRAAHMSLPGTGSDLRLDLFALRAAEIDLAPAEELLRQLIADNVRRIGPYMHEDRFTAFLWQSERSMEYEGATTSSIEALEHEVFHSWFARGVKPASQNDGWFDEAWAVYNTSSDRLQERPLRLSAPPVTLCSQNPFNRVTPIESYTAGADFFAGLAATVGRDQLLSYLSAFYQEHRSLCVTTRQLEADLIRRSGKPELADYFKRFVYGLA